MMLQLHRCRRLLVGVTVVFLAGRAVLAQQPAPAEGRRAEVIRALTSIRSLFGDTISTPAREAVASLLALAAQPIAGRGGEVAIPLPTVRSFQQDEAALRSRNDPQVKAPDVTRAVETDLTTKDAAYKNSPMGLATLITVDVRTVLSTGTETNGWQVLDLPTPLAMYSRAPGDTFGPFSSPTSRLLPPGPYVIWAVNPADLTVRSSVKPVILGTVAGGAVSLMPVSVDVLVPKSLR